MSRAADPSDAKLARRANVRTAVTLLSIAVVFFGGIIAAQYTGANAVGIGAVGFGIIGFLIAVAGRRVRR